jgi:hypothetical protein
MFPSPGSGTKCPHDSSERAGEGVKKSARDATDNACFG